MEIKLKAANRTERRVLDYLEANAGEALAEKIGAGTKTLAGALAYAAGEARKVAAGAGCVCIEDETVFGWIVHYFEEGEISEKKEKPAFRGPVSGESKKEEVIGKKEGKERGDPPVARTGKKAAEPKEMSLAELMMGNGR